MFISYEWNALQKSSFSSTHLVFFLVVLGKHFFFYIFLIRLNGKTCPILVLSQIVAMIFISGLLRLDPRRIFQHNQEVAFLNIKFRLWSGLWLICFCLCLLDDLGFLHPYCDSSAFEKPSTVSQPAHWNMSCAQKFCPPFPGMEPGAVHRCFTLDRSSVPGDITSV